MERNENRFKVIIAEPIAEDGINLLKYDPAFEVLSLKKDEKDRLKEEVKTADALIVRSGVKATRELVELGKNLKVVARAGAGYDNIDLAACSERGIVVTTAPTGNSNGVSELAIGLMLSMIRFIPKADATMKAGKWEKAKLEGTEVEGKTLGIIGIGKIGGKVAEVAAAMGMQIMVLVKNKNKKRTLKYQCEFVDSLDQMLPKVDFLSIHVPLTADTKGMIGKNELEKMKPSAYIINTSRGDVIDEGALYDILKEKKIAGAAIDVYSEEPASKDKFPFIELENVVAMPHLGASTKESQGRTSKMICANLIEALKNGIYIDAVNLPFSISEEKAGFYGPFINLAKRMSQFLAQWIPKVDKITQVYFTSNIRKQTEQDPIILSSCVEMLKNDIPSINLINVKNKLEESNIKIISKESQALQFENSLKFELTLNSGATFSIRGIILAGIPKIVELQNISIEFIPASQGILIKNKNVPGVIGAVAGYLGEQNINISEVSLSKSEPGSEVFQFIGIDSEISDHQMDAVSKLANIIQAKKIKFG
jgi:D-3-phosphoglycerate dehydrogenase